ncbi:MAG: hypothetical protein ACXV3A_02715, partial [Kineosporiaceae bacterium]
GRGPGRRRAAASCGGQAERDMLGVMTAEEVSKGTAAAVAGYAAALHGAARSEHHVVSPLGAWLLLALAGLADGGAEAGAREQLAAALGLPLRDAGRVAVELLDAPHPAVAASVGMWWRDDVATDRLRDYAARLPNAATREVLSGQEQLDGWVRERTLGLIDRFPLRVTPDVLLLLASALATTVRWLQPFTVVPGTELAAVGRPGGFADRVSRALRSVSGHDVRLVRTRSVGLVGAHVAASGDGLAVVSVLGPADADRADVLAAAYEVARSLDGVSIGDALSLFDVPPGPSEFGEIVEDTAPSKGGLEPIERGIAVLPAWQAATELDLLRGPSAGAFGAAGQLLGALLPEHPLRLEARQVAVARYTREGFEAAAVTGLGVRLSAVLPLSEVPRRTLTLRFGRPYAAVAVAVRPPGETRRSAPGAPAARWATGRIAPAWFGVPVFSAWVAEPWETPPDHG